MGFDASKSSSSPRPWRCFPHQEPFAFQPHVFSTSVEVFLLFIFQNEIFNSLLHVRGGVSEIDRKIVALNGSSPRPWRCFRITYPNEKSYWVFSTSVEVFLDRQTDDLLPVRLLHVRGGVSIDAAPD